MSRTLSFTIPFALLALLARCSSSAQEEAHIVPLSDASAAEDAPTTPGEGDAAVVQGDDGDAAHVASDGGGDTTALDAAIHPIDAGPFDAAEGHVLAEFPSNASGSGWERVAPVASATLVPLSAKLDPQSKGNDQWASISHDGATVAFVTTRFGCQSGDCLAIASADGSGAALVEHTKGMEIVPVGRPAVASGGTTIVFPSSSNPNDGGTTPHEADLYAITRTSGVWGQAVLLTSAMVAKNAHDIAVSYDGKTVVFDCGPSPYQAPGTDICLANTDGSGSSVLIAHTAGPSATDQNATHSPDFAPDGTVVFETDWQGTEKVWRRTAPATFAPVSPADESDDNSPCVLPDGRIASLWLNRPGNTSSFHELKVMNADGTNPVMVVTGMDIVDDGQSCGK